MIQHLQPTLTRLEDILDTSMASMAAREGADHGAITSAKGRALLALSRLPQSIPQDALSEDVVAALARVREKLAAEQRMLKQRLDASELVVSLIGEAVQLSDWDGTYGPDQLSRLVRTAPATP
ncbi:MAG: hypothetical protein AAGF45_03660 [Pseudomonadota bacterium]